MAANIPMRMKAIWAPVPGGPEALILEEFPLPAPAEHELLVQIAAAALNRADLLQCAGKYPPPPGVTEILGLEMAGTVVQTGPGVSSFKPGDRVMGLLSGGAYAEYCAVHEGMAWEIPGDWSFDMAAAVPEAFLAAWQGLAWICRLQSGETALIHAGGSGVGSAAIQLARAMGAEVYATASATKTSFCETLGAVRAIDYQKEAFDEIILQETKGLGADVLVDFIGGDYWAQNIRVLAKGGRMAMLGMLGGHKTASFSLAPILSKNLQITGSTLRDKSTAYKIRLSEDCRAFAAPKFAQGLLKPVIDRLFDWRDAAAAFSYMAENRNTGKIILRISE